MDALLAVFLAEMRSARRLARTWVFAVLAVATTTLGYVFFAVLHYDIAAQVPSAVTSPRFLVGSFGGYLLWFLLAASVLLAFDIGARERSERLADALDARPHSNLQLVLGRLAGVVATMAVPVVLALGCLQLFGALGEHFAWPVRATFEPVSLVVFATLDALPALVFWVAAVFVLATTVRNRLLVPLVAFGLLGAATWGLSNAPAWLHAVVAPAPDRLVSDLVSSRPEPAIWLQRASLLAAAGGMLAFAALGAPRRDSPKAGRRYAIWGTLLLAAGGVGTAMVVDDAHRELGERERWLAARSDALASALLVDVQTVTGNARIDPGVALTVDVTLTMLLPNPPRQTLDALFNPALAVAEVLIDGRPAAFHHQDGVLRVRLPAQTRREVDLTVRASGIPDPDFGYLDTAIDHRTVADATALRELGTEASLYDRDYVALMPGVHWLPTLVATQPDFFRADLTVEVPVGWRVAGPGRRQEVGPGVYRFAPRRPLPAVGLVAAAFAHYETEIDGLPASPDSIALELLVSPRHTAPVEHFAQWREELVARLAGVLAEAAGAGLAYPYEALRIVEAPAPLRGYGGGWQMESTLALPGVLLLRERGFPTAHFRARTDGSPANPGDQLESFLKGDRTGGNPFEGLARNLFLYQTEVRPASGDGEEVALRYLCQVLAARLIGDESPRFSARIYADAPSVRTLLGDAFGSLFAGGSASASGDIFRVRRTPLVWERTIGTALSGLTGLDSGDAVNVLMLRGDAAARTLMDGLGRETIARLLAALRDRYRGRTFVAADFEQVAQEVGADLPGLLGNWLHDSALPGFQVSAVASGRLADEGDGGPRYQTRLHVYNGENAPGTLRLRYRVDAPDAPLASSEPIRVAADAAVEAGLVTRAPIRELWVAPYLSLNRGEFPLRVPAASAADAGTGEPLVGARPSGWRPVLGPGIVVDDLDAGFSATPPSPSDVSFETDQGLPAYQHLDPVLEAHWSRQEQPTGWGRYRRTVARIAPGDGDRTATFATVIPAPGRWRLDYHLPDLAVRSASRTRPAFRLDASIEFTESRSTRAQLGSYEMQLVDRDGTRALEFDAAAAEPGWTTLGRFDLPAGEANLVISNRTDGTTVVADAVRWVREGVP